MKRSLLIDVKVGQSLSLDGGRIKLTVEEKSGQRVKLRIVHDGVVVKRADDADPPKPESTGARHARLGSMVPG